MNPIKLLNAVFLLLLILTTSATNVDVKVFCQNDPGTYRHTKPTSPNYNCYQYTRAALLQGKVSLTTGVPSDEGTFGSIPNATIIGDQNFIRVCSLADAKAVAFQSAGHSVIKLNDGRFAFTFDLYPYVETSYFPRAGTTACDGDEEYYDAIPNIAISGGTQVNQGQNITLTLTNNGQALPSYLQLDELRWFFDQEYFTKVSSTNTSITLTAKTKTGSSEISYNLRTGCNGNTTNYKIKSVQVLPNCTGTLNSGPLYSFNMVPGGTNLVEMYLSSWTWVKTSGSASYSTSNGGKNMSFSISSGCSTFNAYNASCNLTFTFCKGSSFMGGDNTFLVFDLINSKVVKEGQVEDAEDSKQILDGLPKGHYVVYINGTSTQYVKSD
ncbi:MAG TPA: hypothetical protein PLM56_12630 [Cyclobacteriaceae bacterium]|jgi:hypothetical protein|nr:hypothetical protein [Cytophagales bacterium]HRE68267.1 hypothetical protein [Cyclobacteriaceae bacterium]HRF34341.1 hypothetical protein [Cyclobacteriaceae bacterium]